MNLINTFLEFRQKNLELSEKYFPSEKITPGFLIGSIVPVGGTLGAAKGATKSGVTRGMQWFARRSWLSRGAIGGAAVGGGLKVTEKITGNEDLTESVGRGAMEVVNRIFYYPVAGAAEVLGAAGQHELNLGREIITEKVIEKIIPEMPKVPYTPSDDTGGEEKGGIPITLILFGGVALIAALALTGGKK